MTDWLLEYGTGYDWTAHHGQLAEDTHELFRNRIVHTWVLKDENFALMFKMMFSEYLHNTPQELCDTFIAQRQKVLGTV